MLLALPFSRPLSSALNICIVDGGCGWGVVTWQKKGHDKVTNKRKNPSILQFEGVGMSCYHHYKYNNNLKYFKKKLSVVIVIIIFKILRNETYLGT